MADSILTGTKKALGLAEEHEAFDPDIIMHINSVFADLHQIGAGPDEGYAIADKEDEWPAFLEEDVLLNNVKSYMVMRVKLIFDPPSHGGLLTALKEQIEKDEWRIRVATDPAVLDDAVLDAGNL